MLLAVVKVVVFFFLQRSTCPKPPVSPCARNLCQHFFCTPTKKKKEKEIKETLPSSLLLFPFPRLVQLHGSAATAEMQLEFLSRPLKPDLSSAFTNWSHLWQQRFEVYLHCGCQVLSAPRPSLRSSLLPLTLSPFFPQCILFPGCLLLSPFDSPYLVFVSLFVFLAFIFLPSPNSSLRSLLSSFFFSVPLSWKLTWMDEVVQSCQHCDRMAVTGSSKSLWDALSVATLFFPPIISRENGSIDFPDR